jgi:hypothetical protein
MDGGVITESEEEFDARSKTNVQRWVSAHIIPVGIVARDIWTHRLMGITEVTD